MESNYRKGILMKSKRYLKALLTLTIFCTGLTGLTAEVLKVVATTEWTAAFCRAAGLDNVRVLAPAALQHPPDYELKPSDIPALMEADLIVFGGYEGMMERIHSHIAGSDTQMLQITTAYAPPVMEASIRDIAEITGTETEAEANIELIRNAFSEARRLTAEAGLNGLPAVVHKFHVPFARGVGLKVVKEFGPAPPGPRLIVDAAESGALLILDNRHNPIAAPIREILEDAGAVELINFPGAGGTRTLAEVILYNARVLTSE